MIKRPPDFIIGHPGVPYLERWWIIPRNARFNIYLHHFLHSDEDRALHDHPWWNVSIVLRGAYIEHLRDGRALLRKPWRLWAPWRLVFRRPESAHRIELLTASAGPAPVWSLFLTGPVLREWGFLCPTGWKHWKAFTKAGAPGEIGPGCGD